LELTEEQRAARKALMNQELSELLALSGKLNEAFNSTRLKAKPDQHYRNNLKEELHRMALEKKKSAEDLLNS
jgi:hypothetical protein